MVIQRSVFVYDDISDPAKECAMVVGSNLGNGRPKKRSKEEPPPPPPKKPLTMANLDFIIFIVFFFG